MDNNWEGHIPAYHNHFVLFFIRQGYHVVSINPKPHETESFIGNRSGKHNGKLQALSFQKVFSYGGLLRFQIARSLNRLRPVFSKKAAESYHNYLKWRSLGKFLLAYLNIPKKDEGTYVIFPYLAAWSKEDIKKEHHEKIFPFFWGGLLMNERRVGKKIFHSHYCRSLGLLKENKLSLVREKTGKPVVWFPDIINSEFQGKSILAQDILEKAKRRNIVSLTGVLGPKKNLLFFLEMAKRAWEKKCDLFFLVAGKFPSARWSEEERRRIDGLMKELAGKNLYFSLHLVPDGNEYNSLFQISKVIFLVNEGFDQSSNTLTKAAYFHKPVLVSDQESLIKERVKKFDIGIPVENGNIEEGLKAIQALLEKRNVNGVPLNLKFKEYCKVHSQDALFQSLKKLVGVDSQ